VTSKPLGLKADTKEIQVKNLVFGVIVSVVAVAAAANTESPYVGQETREIKALSQQEIDDYLNGSGLGYTKAAELNHLSLSRLNSKCLQSL
jgi:hypothetical protein